MDEISSFKKNIVFIYIIHFIIEIIIIVLNIFYYISKYWINISFKIIFLIGIILICFFLFFPLISIYFIYFKNNLSKSFYNKNKIISFIFLVLRIIIGIILNILFWINISKFPSFYKDCPYNYSDSNLNNLKEKIEQYKSNEICQKRICIDYKSQFINENIITDNNNEINNNIDIDSSNLFFNYVCNFDSSKDFDNNEVRCKIIYFNSKDNYYLSFCSKYVFYYFCQRSDPPLKYEIKKNNECPSDNTNLKISIDIFIILNILLSFFPWIFEIKNINKIINKINEISNNNNQNILNLAPAQIQINNLINRTANTSEINKGNNMGIRNSNENINENINNSVKENSQNNESKEQMQYIFIGKETKNNIDDIDSNKHEDEKENIKKEIIKIKIKIKKEDNEDAKEIFNLIKSPQKSISKTNNFESNINQDIINNICINKKKKLNENLFYLKKKDKNENENEEENIIVNKKKNLFINNKNKTLNYMDTNDLIKNNNITNQNNSSEYNKKKNTNILNKIENSYFNCKKEHPENKVKVIKLTKTVKKNKKDKNRIMDNIWKILETQADSKGHLNNQK